jgi:hypothetical protein
MVLINSQKSVTAFVQFSLRSENNKTKQQNNKTKQQKQNKTKQQNNQVSVLSCPLSEVTILTF